ncbi:MAG: Stf0 family sulfotransferase [Verrucomicrobiota bacterium]|nr:Stf0 family sulfotransferase [Verrucomicrobiota bacterium]
MQQEVRKSLIICTTPRSGSTYFANVLQETGLFGAPAEWLHSYCYNQVLSTLQIPDKGTTREFISHLQAFAMKDRTPGIFALKTMWDVFSEFLAEARKERKVQTKSIYDWSLVSDHFPNPRFIFLSRKNKLAQAISYLKATQTGLWHSINLEEMGGIMPGHEASFDPYKIRSTLRNFHEQELGWKKLYWLERIQPMEIVYEDFLMAPLETVQAVAKHVGDIPLPEQLPASQLRPMRDTINTLWAKLYRELEETSIFNPLNELVPDRAAHWLYSGADLELEVPLMPARTAPLQTFTILVGVRNPTQSFLHIGIPDCYCTDRPELILQAVWTRYDDDFFQQVYDSTPLPLRWSPDQLRVAEIGIKTPVDVANWYLDVMPVIKAGAYYRMLGVKSLRISFTRGHPTCTRNHAQAVCSGS